jgi:hypothetical protein
MKPWFIAEKINGLLGDPRFSEALAGHLRSDTASQARLPIVQGRLEALI